MPVFRIATVTLSSRTSATAGGAPSGSDERSAPFSEVATTCSKVMLRTRAAAVVERPGAGSAETKIGSPEPQNSGFESNRVQISRWRITTSRIAPWPVRCQMPIPRFVSSMRMSSPNTSRISPTSRRSVCVFASSLIAELEETRLRLSRRTCCTGAIGPGGHGVRSLPKVPERKARQSSPVRNDESRNVRLVPLSTSMPSAVPHCTEPSTRTPISRTLEHRRKSWHQPDDSVRLTPAIVTLVASWRARFPGRHGPPPHGSHCIASSVLVAAS